MVATPASTGPPRSIPMSMMVMMVMMMMVRLLRCAPHVIRFSLTLSLPLSFSRGAKGDFPFFSNFLLTSRRP
uniref:Putative secreted protein n=1 Tax=Anopheles darlingi TaxID=43151 RepID=A0A2M4D4I3_ANODA